MLNMEQRAIFLWIFKIVFSLCGLILAVSQIRWDKRAFVLKSSLELFETNFLIETLNESFKSNHIMVSLKSGLRLSKKMVVVIEKEKLFPTLLTTLLTWMYRLFPSP